MDIGIYKVFFKQFDVFKRVSDESETWKKRLLRAFPKILHNLTFLLYIFSIISYALLCQGIVTLNVEIARSHPCKMEYGKSTRMTVGPILN